MAHRVGPNGQIVIPKKLRERVGIEPGDEVTFDDDGESVRVIPLRPNETLRGRFTGSGMTRRLETDRCAEPR